MLILSANKTITAKKPMRNNNRVGFWFPALAVNGTMIHGKLFYLKYFPKSLVNTEKCAIITPNKYATEIA